MGVELTFGHRYLKSKHRSTFQVTKIKQSQGNNEKKN